MAQLKFLKAVKEVEVPQYPSADGDCEFTREFFAGVVAAELRLYGPDGYCGVEGRDFCWEASGFCSEDVKSFVLRQLFDECCWVVGCWGGLWGWLQECGVDAVTAGWLYVFLGAGDRLVATGWEGAVWEDAFGFVAKSYGRERHLCVVKGGRLGWP